MGILDKLFGTSETDRPVLTKNDALSDSKLEKFLSWFIDNELFVNVINNYSSNAIFDEGYIPDIKQGLKPSKFNSKLRYWFIEKLKKDIEDLIDVSKTEFKDFLDRLASKGNKTLMASTKIAYKYDLDLEQFDYDVEIEKIPKGAERECYKENLLTDNVIGAELRILGWLYQVWFNDWYQPPETGK